MLGSKPTVEVIIKAKDLASKVVKGFENNIKVIGQAAKLVAKAVLAIGAAAVGAMVGLVKLGERADKIEGVSRVFERAGGSIEVLRKATHGTVADFELMTQSNEALARGVADSSAEFAQILETSWGLAKAMGKDVTEVTDILSAAIGKQTTRGIKNLGIMVDANAANKDYADSIGKSVKALTDAEKREAFRNATLTAAKKLVGDLGGKFKEGAEGAERMAAAWQNLGDKIATVVGESPMVAKFTDAVAGIMSDVVDLLSGDTDLLIEGMKTLGSIAGNALAIGINEGLQAIMNKGPMFARLLPQVFSWNADAARESLAASIAGLGSIAERARAMGQARGGIPTLPGVTNIGSGGGGGGLARGRPLSGTEAELRGLLDAIQKTDAALKGARLDESLAAPGESAEKAAEKVKELVAELTNLDAIAKRFGGREGLLLATAGVSPLNAGLLGPRTEDPNAAYRKKRYSLVPGMVPGTERGLPFGDTLHPMADPLMKAEDRFQQTAGVVAATMGDMAAAAIRGTGSVKESVVSMIGGILERTVKNPLLGGVLGGVFAIGAALYSKNDRPKVVVDDYSSTALSKMSEANKRPIRITNIIESGGRPIAEIEREM